MMFYYWDDDSDFSLLLRKKQDAFLDVYSLYCATKLPLVKEDLIRHAYELSSLDPQFMFEI